MTTASMAGSIVVIAALAFYSTGYFNEKRHQRVNSRILLFYTIGLSLDITATTLMIIGSTRGMITFHGLIGYSSLLGMLADTILLWRHYLKEHPDKNVSRPLHIYSRIAYTWWIIAFITGGALVLINKILAIAR
jgi:hypothetical protein